MKYTLLQILAAVPAIISLTLLSPACADAPSAERFEPHTQFPSKLDYVVFASIADSSRLPALDRH